MSSDSGPDLRARLLASAATDYGIVPTSELPHVWAVMMEMPAAKGVASLVAVSDGSTSMYSAEERLKTKTSPLWPIFYLGHGVITSLRTATETRAPG